MQHRQELPHSHSSHGDVDTKNDETCHFLPYATFAGHILEAELKVNELTDQPFYWILVDAYGGSFDVVFRTRVDQYVPATSSCLLSVYEKGGTPSC